MRQEMRQQRRVGVYFGVTPTKVIKFAFCIPNDLGELHGPGEKFNGFYIALLPEYKRPSKRGESDSIWDGGWIKVKSLQEKRRYIDYFVSRLAHSEPSRNKAKPKSKSPIDLKPTVTKPILSGRSSPDYYKDLFCYIGGSADLPVQNDKSANLPTD